MKKFLSKIFSLLMIGCLSFLCVGCVGSDPDYHQSLIDKLEKGELTEEEFQKALEDSMMVPMYGTKVMYRPGHIDFEQDPKQENFIKYTVNILDQLLTVYGLQNDLQFSYSPSSMYSISESGTKTPTELYYYNYDSIRYQITEKRDISVLETYTIKNDQTVEKTSSENDAYTEYYYSDSNRWIWSFDYDLTGTNYPEGFVTDDTYADDIDSKNSVSTYFMNDYIDNVDTFYQDLNLLTSYQQIYLGATQQVPAEGEDYSELVRALEYVIYCYALNLTPAQVYVEPTKNPAKPYEVSIEGFLSPADAVNYIHGVFSRIGTYVGISPLNQRNLINWILKNVIGEQAISNDSIVMTEGVTKKVYKNEAGDVIRTEYTGGTSRTVDMGREYNRVVADIVYGVVDRVIIGQNDDGSDVNIADRFLASELRDYYGNAFFINGEGGREFEGMPAEEYQSACLMFKEPVEISNMWVALKYDAGNDGDALYDKNAFLEIEVMLNVYKQKTNSWEMIASDKVKVPDGPFDYMGFDYPAGCSGMARFEKLGPENSEEGIKVGPFNTEIGKGVLKGMEYDGRTKISEPVIFSGMTMVRTYYKIIDNPDNEVGAGVPTYTYGIFDSEKFAGDDGCDYMELAFKVIHKAGDVDTNYKFHVGIALVA